ncbi:MAG: hypothetical protein ACPGUD_12995 [Parashewanella sp.]
MSQTCDKVNASVLYSERYREQPNLLQEKEKKCHDIELLIAGSSEYKLRNKQAQCGKSQWHHGQASVKADKSHQKAIPQRKAQVRRQPELRKLVDFFPTIPAKIKQGTPEPCKVDVLESARHDYFLVPAQTMIRQLMTVADTGIKDECITKLSQDILGLFELYNQDDKNGETKWRDQRRQYIIANVIPAYVVMLNRFYKDFNSQHTSLFISVDCLNKIFCFVEFLDELDPSHQELLRKTKLLYTRKRNALLELACLYFRTNNDRSYHDVTRELRSFFKSTPSRNHFFCDAELTELTHFNRSRKSVESHVFCAEKYPNITAKSSYFSLIVNGKYTELDKYCFTQQGGVDQVYLHYLVHQAKVELKWYLNDISVVSCCSSLHALTTVQTLRTVISSRPNTILHHPSLLQSYKEAVSNAMLACLLRVDVCTRAAVVRDLQQILCLSQFDKFATAECHQLLETMSRSEEMSLGCQTKLSLSSQLQRLFDQFFVLIKARDGEQAMILAVLLSRRRHQFSDTIDPQYFERLFCLITEGISRLFFNNIIDGYNLTPHCNHDDKRRLVEFYKEFQPLFMSLAQLRGLYDKATRFKLEKLDSIFCMAWEMDLAASSSLHASVQSVEKILQLQQLMPVEHLRVHTVNVLHTRLITIFEEQQCGKQTLPQATLQLLLKFADDLLDLSNEKSTVPPTCKQQLKQVAASIKIDFSLKAETDLTRFREQILGGLCQPRVAYLLNYFPEHRIIKPQRDCFHEVERLLGSNDLEQAFQCWCRLETMDVRLTPCFETTERGELRVLFNRHGQQLYQQLLKPLMNKLKRNVAKKNVSEQSQQERAELKKQLLRYQPLLPFATPSQQTAVGKHCCLLYQPDLLALSNFQITEQNIAELLSFKQLVFDTHPKFITEPVVNALHAIAVFSFQHDKKEWSISLTALNQWARFLAYQPEYIDLPCNITIKLYGAINWLSYFDLLASPPFLMPCATRVLRVKDLMALQHHKPQQAQSELPPVIEPLDDKDDDFRSVRSELDFGIETHTVATNITTTVTSKEKVEIWQQQIEADRSYEQELPMEMNSLISESNEHNSELNSQSEEDRSYSDDGDIADEAEACTVDKKNELKAQSIVLSETESEQPKQSAEPILAVPVVEKTADIEIAPKVEMTQRPVKKTLLPTPKLYYPIQQVPKRFTTLSLIPINKKGRMLEYRIESSRQYELQKLFTKNSQILDQLDKVLDSDTLNVNSSQIQNVDRKNLIDLLSQLACYFPSPQSSEHFILQGLIKTFLDKSKSQILSKDSGAWKSLDQALDFAASYQIRQKNWFYCHSLLYIKNMMFMRTL